MSTTTKTVVITGGTAGIGEQSAIGLAEIGANVIITGRNRERGEMAVARIKEASKSDKVDLVVGDIASLAKIKDLAAAITKKCDGKLDALVNNAGYLGKEGGVMSEDGLEMHFAVNVFAPYKLAHALLPTLKASGEDARVVNLTGGQDPIAVDIDNLQVEKGFQGLNTYGASKAITESMTMMLSKEFESEGVTVNTVFPGRASTSMTKSMGTSSLPGVMKLFYPVFKLMFRDDGGKSAKKASRSTIFGVTNEELNGVTGKYYNTDCVEMNIHESGYTDEVQGAIKKVIDSVKDE